MVSRRSGLWATWVPIAIAAAGCLGGGVAWLVAKYEHEQEQRSAAEEENRKLIAVLVRVRSDLGRALSVKTHLDETYGEYDPGVLESYVYRARENNGQGSDLQYEEIMQLADINRSLRKRIQTYLPCSISQQYAKASSDFLAYVDIWLQRAASIKLLAKSQEMFPSYAVFPQHLHSALEAELKARQAGDPTSVPGLECLIEAGG